MADTKTPEMKNSDSRKSQDGSNEQLRSEANKSDSNQTMRHEQAKGQVSGQAGEQRQEKSAIGGGQPSGQTGEPGRARNELDESKGQAGQKSEFDKSRSEPAGEKKEFDKNRSEPTGQR